ncbi:MAG: hypothetical protein SOX26_03800 [Phocaeicola sp.]|nr:hypothetical protein [Phocaeicola sp.]
MKYKKEEDRENDDEGKDDNDKDKEENQKKKSIKEIYMEQKNAASNSYKCRDKPNRMTRQIFYLSKA